MDKKAVKFKLGDIVGIAPEWWQVVFLALVKPYIYAFHFLLIGPYIKYEEDWVIYESIGSGVRVGRLSWYRGKQATVFRPTKSKVGKVAVNWATIYGRCGYDYLLLLKLFWFGIKYLFTHGFKPIPYDKIPDFPDRTLICVELVTKAYERCWPLVPEGVAATPAAIKAAELNGKLHLVYEGTIE